MGLFNFLTREKQETSLNKVINSEVSRVSSSFITPKFNRRLALKYYEGYWAAAINYTANASSNGVLRLYAKTKKNGRKCRYTTIKNKNDYQNKYIEGRLEDRPNHTVLSKIMDSVENFEIVQGHPITQLFRRANIYQTSKQLFYEIFLSLEIFGDVFVYVVSYTDGTPAQLYVLQSQYVEVVPAKPGTGKLVKEYLYETMNGNTVSFSEDTIIHIKYPNPDSLFYGKGKIELGFDSALLNRYSHDYQQALYRNNAVPDFFITNKDKSADKNATKNFFEKMKLLNRGAKNRGNVLAVDADIEIKTVAFKPRDLGDINYNIQEIAAISGCPINKLIGNDNIKANSEEQNISWLRHTILPMMQLVASGLGENLLKRYNIEDGDAFLEFDNVIPQDQKQKRQEHETYSKIGVLTSNEIRIRLGEKPLGPELDEVYFNGNKLGDNKNNDNNSVQSSSDDKSINLNNNLLNKIDNIIKDISVLDKKYTKQIEEDDKINIILKDIENRNTQNEKNDKKVQPIEININTTNNTSTFDTNEKELEELEE